MTRLAPTRSLVSSTPNFPNGLIVSAGNVLIGTTTPSATLSVSGVIAPVGSGYLDFQYTSNPIINKSASTRLDIGPVGGLWSANPLWFGLHLNSPTVTQNGVTQWPRVSHFYSYTTATNPTDLTYNIATVNSGTLNNSINITAEYGTVSFGTSNTERMRISATGNVGIGTTTPYATLHLHNTVSSGEAIIKFTNNNNIVTTGLNVGDGLNIGLDSQGNSTIWNYETSAIVFGTTSLERMRISSAGNVGIGTTSPGSTLDVNGNTFVTGLLAVSPTGVTKDIGYNGSFVSTKAVASGQHINLVRVGNKVWSIGYVYNTNNFTIGEGQATDSSFTNPGFVIQSNTGLVGIGTTTPNLKLEVNQIYSAVATSALRTTPQILIKGFAGAATYHSGIAFSMYEHNAGYWGSAILSHDDTGSYGSGMTFYTSTGSATPSPAERMRITSAGSVGIGTASPASSAFLDVAGNVRSTGEFRTTGLNGLRVGTLLLRNDGSNTYFLYGTSDTAGDNWNSLRPMHIANSTGDVYFGQSLVQTTSAGFLYIKGTLSFDGTSSGYVRFKAAASAGSATYTLPSADGTNLQVLTTSGAGILSWTTPAGGASLSVANTWTATQTFSNTTYSALFTGGNVGIGTTAPSYRLHLAGETSVYPEAINISATTHATSRRASINIDDWMLGQDLFGTGTKDFFLYQKSTAVVRLFVASAGNVGIGTNSPGSTLDVKGTLRLSGSTSGYVGFAPAAAAGSTTYTLPSADGTNLQVLTTSGGGILSWTTPAGGGGGASLSVANTWTATQTFSTVNISGNLSVAGTFTTYNSVVTTIENPTIDIGGGLAGVAPSIDDGYDRGITFQWHNGTSAKKGFFGFDRSAAAFLFVPDATITSGIVSGTGLSLSATSVSAPTVIFTDQQSSPSAPGSGLTTLYSKSGSMYYKSGSAGSETSVTSTGKAIAMAMVFG